MSQSPAERPSAPEVGAQPRRAFLANAAGAALAAAGLAGQGCSETPPAGKGRSVQERVVAIVAQTLGIEADKITPQKRFIEDLGADSLDCVEMVIAFEDEFGIQIPDEEAEKINTVAQAISSISRATGKQAPGGK